MSGPLLGWHWILDAGGADPAALADGTLMADLLRELPGILGLSRVGEPRVGQPGHGGDIAGVVLIAESHASLHASPAAGALHADIFSCRAFDPQPALRRLAAVYRFRRHRARLMERRSP